MGPPGRASSDAGRPYTVGLTGGIATGKSVVGRMLGELGAFVVDADRLARELMRPGGPAHAAVTAHFGEALLGPGGEIDRAALADRVFREPADREALNRLVHPLIREEAWRRIQAHRGYGPFPLAVFEAALLVETGAYRDFRALVVVRCDESTQLRRLRSRDGLTREQAQARIRAQAPQRDKLATADHVIDTEGPIEATRARVGEVFEALRRAWDADLRPSPRPPRSA